MYFSTVRVKGHRGKAYEKTCRAPFYPKVKCLTFLSPHSNIRSMQLGKMRQILAGAIKPSAFAISQSNYILLFVHICSCTGPNIFKLLYRTLSCSEQQK